MWGMSISYSDSVTMHISYHCSMRQVALFVITCPRLSVYGISAAIYNYSLSWSVTSLVGNFSIVPRDSKAISIQ